MSAKAPRTQHQKPNQRGNLGPVPANANLTNPIFLAGLPEAPDGCCGGSRITGNQIPWADGANEVGALRKMLTLVTASEDAAVSSWSGSRPAGDLLSGTQDQSQSPLGVNPSDCSNWDQIGSENVFDYDQILSDLNPGKPKEQKAYVADGEGYWDADQGSPQAIGCIDGHKSQQHGRGDHDGQDLGAFGYKDLHRPSFASSERFSA